MMKMIMTIFWITMSFKNLVANYLAPYSNSAKQEIEKDDTSVLLSITPGKMGRYFNLTKPDSTHEGNSNCQFILINSNKNIILDKVQRTDKIDLA